MSAIATKQTKIIHRGTAKKSQRTRRGLRAVSRHKTLAKVRLRVHKTGQHTYAQVIATDGKVLVAASTVEKAYKAGHGANIAAATWVGQTVAERAKKAGVTDVVFDRAGFLYHGRVKALADAAREAGLTF